MTDQVKRNIMYVMDIEVSGKTQDEALENARKAAQELDFQDVSLKNIISITYSATLYNPIEKPQEEQEQPQA